MKRKVIRTLCGFTEYPNFAHILDELGLVATRLTERNYEIQTKRICFKETPINRLKNSIGTDDMYLGVGLLDRNEAQAQLDDFLHSDNISFNLDLTAGVDSQDVEMLLRIVREKPSKTFQFAFTFNNRPSSPFFPSATFEREGFAIGLQPTDLAEHCDNLLEWLAKMGEVWNELCEILNDHPSFLGIDSSVAPLFLGGSSLVNFLKRIYGSFSGAVTTDAFITLSNFLVTQNPKPVGLCGLILPCLEDFELADEYAAGEFTIERNLFLSLHSGLGVDTYPIGTDEAPGRILDILRLTQGLSAKFSKPLSVRFVSDGKAQIGDVTDFQNRYLKDVIIRPL
jgi:hypothetical protein